MFHKILRALQGEVSGDRALRSVYDIARYHRIQASPGYREAAQWCLARLQDAGLEACIRSYPATGHDWNWSSLVPREWHCRSAELWLLAEGGRRQAPLGNFGEIPLSLIQRSAATDPGGVTAEVVAVAAPEERETYVDGTLAGKVIFVGNCNLMRVAVLADSAGVAGILTDNMTYNSVREPADVATARQYTSFWWWQDAQPRLWGFVLSPNQGRALRRKLELGPVQVWGRVDSEFVDGSIENVEAVIPGSEEGEVLLVSHLCHPKPSANDNAGGPATALEVAFVLRQLIESGALPTPRRSIRLLLPPEWTGTCAHLAHDTAPADRTVAALNLDMVSQNQEQTGSVLVGEFPPLACPSFTGDLLAAIMEGLADLSSLGGTGNYHSFRWAVTPFSGGSDHYILADPSVGVPCPMLINWPDKYYHTSFDTPDRADPKMLARVAALAGTYLYFLANAGAAEASWLSGEMAAAFTARLHQGVQGAARRLAGRGLSRELARRDLEEFIGFQTQCKTADLQSLQRLARGDASLESAIAGAAADVALVAERERRRLALTLGAAYADAPAGGASGLASVPSSLQLVPHRLVPGPVSLRELVLSKLSPEEQDAWHAFSRERKVGELGVCLLYWCDGQRPLAEVCRMAEMECGVRDEEYAARYFDLLSRLRIVQLRRPSEAAD